MQVRRESSLGIDNRTGAKRGYESLPRSTIDFSVFCAGFNP
jgi:hypothetical protein